jgi:uncharacterized repeat protein (TIGR01451 family)
VAATVATFPNGGRLTYTIAGTLSPSATGTLSTTATIGVPSGVIDPALGNNTATDLDTIGVVGPTADLSARVTNNLSSLERGLSVTYDAVIANAGPTAAPGSTVTISIPGELTSVTWTCSASGGAVCPAASGAGSVSGTIPAFPSGGTLSYRFTAAVSLTASGTISVTAAVAPPSGLTDPALGNNSATDADPVGTPPPPPTPSTPSADLSISKSDGLSDVTPGQSVVYTIRAANAGPDPVSGATVTDVVPAGLTLGAWSCTASSGSSCPSSGSGNLSASVSLHAGGSATFTVAATMGAGISGSIANTAGISVPTGTNDPASGNNVATDIDLVSTPQPSPRVDITKAAASRAVVGVRQADGRIAVDLTYTLVVRNTSAVPAPNVQVVDDLGATFAAGAPTMTIQAGPSLGAGTAPLTLASGANAYNGTTRTALLTGTDILASGAERAITFTVRLLYPSATALPAGDLNNTARTSTSGTPGGAPTMSDDSTDVSASNDAPRSDDVPRPTPATITAVAAQSGARPLQLDACVIGRVFADKDGNRILDDGEPGVPGVRLRFENGTAIETDIEGKYSYCGLTPATHVLKVDRTSLPEGARLVASSNRNAGDAESLFLDLKFGDVRRADFIVDAEQDAAPVLDWIAERKARGEVWTPLFDALDRSVVSPDNRLAGPTLPSDGGQASANSRFDAIQPVRPLGPETSNLPDSRPLTLDADQHVVGTIRLSADHSEVRADGHTPVRLTIRLVDADGRPVTTPVVATLETSGARLQAPGSADSLVDADRVTPGTQVRIQNGEGAFDLVAPDTARDVQVRVTAGDASADGVLSVVPDLRPLLAVGLLEGTVSLNRLDAGAVSPVRPSEAFDRELREVSRTFDNGRGQMGARGALFLQGTVKGSTLLTMSYDSERADRGALFRDIQPDAFYPVYGDGSTKRFDAQTSGRFYLRADRGRTYVVYGDMQTAAGSYDAQQLGIYSRTLTGLQHHFENRRVAVNVFASRDTLRQVIDEMGGRGLSGPYTVSNPNGVSGTEKVEIVTRDRNQPAVILSTVPLTRFTDYEFEPFSGRLLFRRAVPAVDERLNPVSVRVTYEVERGGEKAWVGGANAQFSVGRYVQLGGSWAEDGTAGAPYRLRSVNGTVRLGGSTTLVVEGAQSTGTVNTNGFNQSGLQNLASRSGSVEGDAARVELRHESARVSARLFAGTSDEGFNNPASTLTGGRSEAGGRATVAVTEKVKLVGEAIRSEDRLTDGHREGALVSVEATLAKGLALEFGMRRATESLSPAQGTSVGVLPFSLAGSGASFGFGSASNINPMTGLPLGYAGLTPRLSAVGAGVQPAESLDVLTVRARLNATIHEAVHAYGEAEQDVRDSAKRLAAVGGQVRVSERNRVYLRHEFLSSLDGPYALSDRQRRYHTVFGVSSTYLTNADAFSEYRLRDAISGREAEAAIGLRNLWPLAEGVRLSTGIERLHAIGDAGGVGAPGIDQTATAVSLGLEYTRSPRLKGTGRIEWRRDPAADSWLSTIGLARKVSKDWTLLSKNYYQLTSPDGAARQRQDRFWFGGAYRDLDTNRLNLLSRYEFTFEELGVVGSGRRTVHAISTNADTRPSRKWTLSGQHAAKWVDEGVAGGPGREVSQLVSGRVGYDLARRWDVGALGSLQWGDRAVGRHTAIGGEIGFLLRDNVWLSGGYNVTGFLDRDLSSITTTARGAFVRMRMKFDEDLFRREGPGTR